MVKYMVIALIAVASSTAAAEKSVETFLRRRLSPIAGCSAQSECLQISGDGLNGGYDTCDADGKRTVCISWNNDGGTCVKDTSDSVSHACPVVDGVLNDDLNVKTENWGSGSQICVTVTGGEVAVFGVKDGSGCSDSGDYTVASGDTGTCSGPLTACQGGNKKECSWSFPTTVCDSSDDDTAGDDDGGGGGGGGQTCFSSEDMVQVENGDMKHFKDVKVGDSILSANRDGEISYSKVLFLPHGENDTPTTFVEIKTESGRMIKMTRRHLLPLCSGELVVAQNLKHGSCLKTVGGDELVTTTTETVINGVYTAIAENEFLVVNGFVASPFASSDGAKHAIFNQTDVDSWCSSNNWLVYESLHHHLGSDIESAPSQDCETMLEMMFSNFKDEPIGWGQNGWGYKGWKNPSSRSQ